MFLRKEVRKGKTSGTGKVLGRKKKKKKTCENSFQYHRHKNKPHVFITVHKKKKKNQAIELPKIIVT